MASVAERALLRQLAKMGIQSEFVRMGKHPIYRFSMDGKTVQMAISNSPSRANKGLAAGQIARALKQCQAS